MDLTEVDRKPRRLVLCFDGTGDTFKGNESDTNVIKIYQMLDRRSGEQFHYYQPGIGTFATTIRRQNIFAKIRLGMRLAIDQAFGTTFEYHVCAGYEFLMKYYSPGDVIYIFGFSRGAYTARFLAEMLHELGLLSRGNEEMICFAFASFSKVMDARGTDQKTPADIENERYLAKFKKTFCRPSVTVYFLGLFDCVNSVGRFEIPFRRASYRYIAMSPAKHIRHAVSIHERRLKFKPALFIYSEQSSSDIKEVYFAGDHSNVGGGYNYQGSTRYLISDIPLAWMVDEIRGLDDEPAGRLNFNEELIHKLEYLSLAREWSQDELKDQDSLARRLAAGKEIKLHDTLRFGGGVAWYTTVLWWVVEILPIFTRLELENGEWVPRYWPPNMGAPRDITSDAIIHCSVLHLHEAGVVPKMPKLGGDNPPVLKDPLMLLRLAFQLLCPRM